MSLSPEHAVPPETLADVVRKACARIAPTWPLDRFIAVNPLWGMVESPLPEVAAELQALSGARLLMPRAWYREAHREGTLNDAHLRAALEGGDSKVSLAELRGLLEKDELEPSRRARVVDVVDGVDRERGTVHALPWRVFVTHSVSQFCAAYFDEGQAQRGPARDGGLYASWRRYAERDRSPRALMGMPAPRLRLDELPETAAELIEAAVGDLGVPAPELERYLWSLLLDQNGWASFCAYRRWTARLGGTDDAALSDLLAIRLGWERALLGSGGDAVAEAWKAARVSWPKIDGAARSSRSGDWLLQRAVEIAWRAPVLEALPSSLRTARPEDASVQAVFCLDVRSETFRRALESVSPTVQTLGFGGFFGVPMDYLPLGAASARPQLPGLLAPRLRAEDTGLPADAEESRSRHLALSAAWKAFQKDAFSTFTFVEALGITYAGKLLADGFGLKQPGRVESAGLSSHQESARKPRLTGTTAGSPLTLADRGQLAEAMLRGMSLTRRFARIVLLAGHGSITRNNPHAAGLNCGACGGQTGEANARVAAALLNDPGVRDELSRRGVPLPDTTWFVAALHQTTTDDVVLFDLDEVPASHHPDLEKLRAWLAQAGVRCRAERAPRLGLSPENPAVLHAAMRARSRDWAQVRPEWGLANNAAFIIAPREHSRALNLEGRCFLHEYRHQEDDGFRVLESIMTAPLVVAHWINFQYYVSTVDNLRYGSGNKLLHNIVGGHIGVFEGNGGDLRIGLPLQSLHDGKRSLHTPLRLSVFIEAPASAIDQVLERHATVRALALNGWLSLFQLDEHVGQVRMFREGQWSARAA